MAVEMSCQGCRRDIVASNVVEDDVHYVCSGANTDLVQVGIFCASCWDGVESWFLNTAIDQAVAELLSACSGSGLNVASADTTLGTYHPLGAVIAKHTGDDTALTGV